jgi:hypothetical protein
MSDWLEPPLENRGRARGKATGKWDPLTAFCLGVFLTLLVLMIFGYIGYDIGYGD